jgi:hypothetical protein
MVFVMTFTNTTAWLSQIVTATMFSPVNETSNGLPENQTMSFSQNPLLENINNRLPSTVDIGYLCYGTDFNMNRLAIRVMQPPISSHIVYLDPKGKLIDRVNIRFIQSLTFG